MHVSRSNPPCFGCPPMLWMIVPRCIMHAACRMLHVASDAPPPRRIRRTDAAAAAPLSPSLPILSLTPISHPHVKGARRRREDRPPCGYVTTNGLPGAPPAPREQSRGRPRVGWSTGPGTPTGRLSIGCRTKSNPAREGGNRSLCCDGCREPDGERPQHLGASRQPDGAHMHPRPSHT